jgi:bifunctional DNA-binding transcriptional regulator/antitoxin component of YhaV-PrlF toxin-antitoxin module
VASVELHPRPTVVIRCMADETIMGRRGRVFLPPAVLDRMGWSGGADVELIETRDGVLLRSRVRPTPERRKKAKHGVRG